MKVRGSIIALTIASATTCAARVPSPEPVPLDRVECARCRMLISSDRGGGEIVSPTEDTRFYDDIDCLAADWGTRAHDGRAYVRADGHRWLDAAAAAYARPADVRTAMGSGLVAFVSADDARAADRGGRAITFDDVVRLAGARR
jgi:nitrous oxide reductase accessory protein NosL